MNGYLCECIHTANIYFALHKSHSDNDRLIYRDQCRLYNSLLKKAQSNYFSSLFVNCSDSKSFLHSIDKVLNRNLTSNAEPPALISAHQFSSFFTDKIKSLRANPPLIDVNLFSFPDQLAPVFFFLFEPVTTAEIRNLVLSSLKSTCLSDPVTSKLLLYCVGVIVPVVTRIINLLLSTGIFPNDFKSAFVKPILKNYSIDSKDIKITIQFLICHFSQN